MRKLFHLTVCAVLTAGGILSGQQDSFPRYRGWVNDFAGVISYEYQDRLTALASEVKTKTGSELTIVTVETVGEMSVEEYASRLFEKWGVGERGKDNGVLFLLALEERKVRIEVGYGLEGILPDITSGQIRDTYILPDFRSGNYGSGFYKGMAAAASIIAEDAGVRLTGSPAVVQRPPSSRQGRGGGIVTIILFIFLMIVTRGRILPWLLLGSMMGGGRRGGGFGGFGRGGGFGGFGGGMSGGGGATGSF
jgi:uncharacterized protein